MLLSLLASVLNFLKRSWETWSQFRQKREDWHVRVWFGQGLSGSRRQAALYELPLHWVWDVRCRVYHSTMLRMYKAPNLSAWVYLGVWPLQDAGEISMGLEQEVANLKKRVQLLETLRTSRLKKIGVIFSWLKVYAFPRSHIPVIHVLGQRVPIITPFDAPNAVSQNICSIGLIPPHNIAVLLCALP